MPEELVALPGSERGPLPHAAEAGPADANARAEVTLILRRHAAGAVGASEADVAHTRAVLTALGLTVTSVHPRSRRVKVAGTVGSLSAAFGTSVRLVRSGSVTHRYREGALYLPRSLDGVVEAVLGLDDRPQARAHFRPAADAGASGSFTPAQVADLYGFPPEADGTGQTVAVIELGGGYLASDLAAYFGGLGIAVPSVTAVSVDGATNTPGSAADLEVALDIDVLGAAAPGVAQLVYFAPNSDQGFVDAVAEAAHATPAPVAISISWGQSEDQWTAQARTALDGAIADACTLGITVCVAAGDDGSADGASDGLQHCDFPASSPNALACGGTRLVGSGSVISAETVWNDGAGSGACGGGVSDAFPVPTWQAAVGVPASANAGGPPGRGVPDVAGNADPQTGYQIMSAGKAQVVGGTSAVAPLWAALIARLAQATSQRFGLIQPALYAGVAAGQPAPGFNDIVTGSNGAYKAGPGWDACTGLGSPNAPALLTRLKSPTPSPDLPGSPTQPIP